jgi:uncharacterized RDD family membrane protein YckC
MSFADGDSPNPYQSPLTSSFEPLSRDDGSPRLASRMNRLGAAIIDGIIGISVTVPVMFLTGYFQRAMQNQVSWLETTSLTIYGLVIFFIVHGYLLATRGQTVGKMLAKIKIVDYHTDRILPFAKLVGFRYIPVWIVSMIPLVSLLGLVNVLFIFGEQRRCVHDYIAGTKVVDVAT